MSFPNRKAYPIIITNTAEAVNATSGGSLTVYGGAAISKSLIIGSGLTAGSSTFSNISAGASNFSALTAGNINFTGDLYKNGALYISSQWTSVGNDLTYTSGNITLSGTANVAAVSSGSLLVGNVSATTITGGTLQISGTTSTGTLRATTAVATTYTGGTLQISGTSSTGTLRATTAIATTYSGGNMQLSGTISAGSLRFSSASGASLALSTGLTTGTILGTTIAATTFTGGDAQLTGVVSAGSMRFSSASGASLALSTGLTTGAVTATTYTGGDMQLSGGVNLAGSLVAASNSNTIGSLITTTSGSVVIGSGSINPFTKLDITGDIHIRSSDRNGGGIIKTSGESSISNKLVYYSNRGNGGHIFRTNISNAETEVVRITQTGRLGIGTDNPGEALDVRGNLRVGNNTAGNYIAFYGVVGDGPELYNHSYIGERRYDGTEQSELLLFKGNDVVAPSGPDRIRLLAAEHRFDTYTSVLSGSFDGVGTSGTNRLTITSAGNVGIGTSFPSHQLHVTGTQLIESTQSVGNSIPSNVSGGALNILGDVIISGSRGLYFTNHGSATPSFTTRSAGTKVVLRPELGSNNSDYALGIETSNMWLSTSTMNTGFKWYQGTTNTMSLETSGSFVLSSTTNVTGVGSGGTLTVLGGAGISKSLVVGENLSAGALNISGSSSLAGLSISGVTNVTDSTQSTSTLDGALVVAGGVGIGKNLNVGGNITVTGDLTVQGTTTTVNTETTLVEDNLLVLNNGPAGAADGGVLVKRYTTGTSGSVNYAGIFYKEAEDEITLAYTDSDPGSSPVTITDYIPVRGKAMTLVSTTDASGVGSGGSLTVLGGAAISKSLIVGESITTGTLRATDVVGSTATATTYTGGDMQLSGTASVGSLRFTSGTGSSLVMTTGLTTGTLLGTTITATTYTGGSLALSGTVSTGTLRFTNATGGGRLVLSGTNTIGDANPVNATAGNLNSLGDVIISGTRGLYFTSHGLAAPSFSTRSAGTKVVLWPSLSSSAVDYALGIETNNVWFSVPSFATQGFRWYQGTTNTMSLQTGGSFVLSGTANATSATAGGALTVSGGASIAKDAYVGGSFVLSGTANATSATAGGALTVAGGASIAKDAYVGGSIIGNTVVPTIRATSFSVSETDKNRMFLVSSAIDITLLNAATAGAGFTVSFVKTDSVANQINIYPTSCTIDDYSNYILSTKGESVTLVSDGTNWDVLSTRTTVFASVYSIPGTYTFTVPNPITTVYACAFGAGGGGGSGAGNSGNGGGGGGYVEGTISVTPGEALTITVGEGGAAGVAGGTSSVGGLTATGGGAGGVNDSTSYGANGAAGYGSGGSINRSGGAGGQAPSQTSGSGGGGGGAGHSAAGSAGAAHLGGNGSGAYGGAGASAVTTNGTSVRVLNFFREGGGGASGNLSETTTAGNDGGFPGGGGSGSGGATTAGSGGDGCVVIFY